MAQSEFDRLLRLALDAERDARWLDSFELCAKALAIASADADALNLLGRLCTAGGDAAQGIALQLAALHTNPDHASAKRDLSKALGAVKSPGASRAAFDRAVAQAPEIACHHRLPGTLTGFAGLPQVEALLRSAIDCDPSFAPAHAALANVLVRKHELASAVHSYRTAVMLDPAFAEAHLALAALLEALRDEANADAHYAHAMQKHLYLSNSGAARTRILVLKAPGRAIANTTIDFAINHYRTATHVQYVDAGAPQPQTGEYDVLYNGVGEYEWCEDARRQAASLIDSQTKPVINHPQNVARANRARLAHSLEGISDCFVPPAVRLSRAGLAKIASGSARAAFAFPVIIRPVDSDRGDGLENVQSADEFAGYLERRNEDAFTMSPFIDYRSADNYFRKYRVAVVDGTPYPYHLAISPRWMVHYLSSPMEQHAWMREEEERFLAGPASVFGSWDTAFAQMARALGLDYFAVDCAVHRDGRVLVFEAGPNMLVHCLDEPEMFGYKYRYVPRIFDAVQRLIESRAAS